MNHAHLVIWLILIEMIFRYIQIHFDADYSYLYLLTSHG